MIEETTEIAALRQRAEQAEAAQSRREHDLADLIAAHAAAEATLRENQEMLHLANTVPSIVWEALPDGTISC
jgi:hypothetical protein